jgi:hypothetical protein
MCACMCSYVPVFIWAYTAYHWGLTHEMKSKTTNVHALYWRLLKTTAFPIANRTTDGDLISHWYIYERVGVYVCIYKWIFVQPWEISFTDRLKKETRHEKGLKCVIHNTQDYRLVIIVTNNTHYFTVKKKIIIRTIVLY